ncbi:MAG: hypothetical protein OEZ01_05530 [Candidatus Heimdallarchaeota archaeon]|nr:hypothetical protein [Candidatus Heimdallarchaeota archaeon]MDH5645445.1 hypothetical protein [Candidatus Heimdallarchaeota archaeon]
MTAKITLKENDHINNPMIFSNDVKLDQVFEIQHQLIQVFSNGFSKLNSKGIETLKEINIAFSTSPLNTLISEAITGLNNNQLTSSNFDLLAIVMASIDGSAYDSLFDELNKLMENQVSLIDNAKEINYTSNTEDHENFLESIKSWLIDLAIMGFTEINMDVLESFEQVMDTLENIPELMRLNVILRGFIEEITTEIPITSQDEFPAKRWLGLWLRSYLLTMQLPKENVQSIKDCKLKIIGVQKYSHDYFTLYTFHGILDHEGNNRLIQIEAKKFTINEVSNNELLDLLNSTHPELFKGLEENLVIQVKQGMISGNYLILEKFKTTTTSFDIYETLAVLFESKTISYNKQNPYNRHPLLLKYPVLCKIENITKDGTSKFDWGDIPIRFDKVGTLNEKWKLANSKGIFGFIQFDNGWWISPVTILGDKNQYIGYTYSQDRSGKNVYEVLKERSNAILRSKS